MTNLIVSWAGDNVGAAAALLLLLAAAVFFFGRWFEKWRRMVTDVDSLKHTVSEEGWVRKMFEQSREEFARLREEFALLRGEFVWSRDEIARLWQESIRSRLDVNEVRAAVSGGERTGSPRRLSERGEKAAAAADADAILAHYYGDLKKQVYDSKPKNEYDIQRASMEAMLDMDGRLSEEDENAIKKAAFNEGFFFRDVLLIFAIVLRDKLLTEREKDGALCWKKLTAAE